MGIGAYGNWGLWGTHDELVSLCGFCRCKHAGGKITSTKRLMLRLHPASSFRLYHAWFIGIAPVSSCGRLKLCPFLQHAGKGRVMNQRLGVRPRRRSSLALGT